MQLQPWADEHDRLEVKIQRRKSLGGCGSDQPGYGACHGRCRSSSALLAELRRLVPKSIRVNQAQINGNALDLSGEVLMPDGLRTLNALMLSMGESPLFDEDGVTLQRPALTMSRNERCIKAPRLRLIGAICNRCVPGYPPSVGCSWSTRSGATPAAFASGGRVVRMTNFSGIGRKGIWSWLTPERAVLVGPVSPTLVWRWPCLVLV